MSLLPSWFPVNLAPLGSPPERGLPFSGRDRMPQDTLDTPRQDRLDPESEAPRQVRAQVIERWNDWALVRFETGEERWVDLGAATYQPCAAPSSRTS